MENEISAIKSQVKQAAFEIIETAKLKKGQILVVGCSSSEVVGHKIGTDSKPEIGNAIFAALKEVLQPAGVFLAAQCCEHLNRAIIIEREALPNAAAVNVVPHPGAGGSFATAAYYGFDDPMALEGIEADAGLDIGNTLIGMHLKHVAIPLRLSLKQIGDAPLTAARTRPKYIGGARATYDDNLK